MAIKLQTMECKRSELATLADIRKEILAAATRAEEAGRHDKLVIELPQGKHSVTEPFVLSLKENPELSHVDVTLCAEVAGGAEINSLVRLDGKQFKAIEGKEYQTYQFKKEKGKYPLFNDFFLNYKRIYKSKSEIWRNLDALTDDERDGKVKREGFWAPIEIAERVASDDLGSTELVIYIEWVFSIFHVKKIDLTKTREVDGKTYALVILADGEMDTFCTTFARHLNIGNREMFFQNAPALLTTNSFAYDYSKGKLYLNAAMPEYMWCHALEYPACETLIELDGIVNFTVRDVAFSGTTCKYGCENVYRSGQANTIPSLPDKRAKAAAIFARDTRGLTVDGCNFRNLGTNAVQVVDHNVRTTVKNSRFFDVSMSGISIGNPSWDWQIEKNRTFCARIENNVLKHIGYEYPASVALYVGQVDGLKILHNTVEDCAYSSVSVGWNWSPQKWELGEKVNIRNAEIAYNYFHNFMQLLRDGGAVYVLGSNCNRFTTAERFNRMHDNYAVLDELVKMRARYGYYCDGACSNWDVSNSVVINVDCYPIFSQPHPQALSYHNHFRDIYSNTQRNPSSHVPERDVVVESYYLVEGTPDKLLEAYPEATKKIRDAAGADIVI